ncbi:MAG: response regulator [Candidatus Polarisedimenticolia bacterium]|nr:response regulator [bacterium]
MARIEETLRFVPGGAALVDAAGTVRAASERFGEMLGAAADGLAGRPLAELLDTGGRPIAELLDAISGADAPPASVLLRTAGGRAPALLVGAPAENDLIIAALPVDAASSAPDMLARLAAGVAHDFNNMLTAILGNVSLARLALAPDHAAQTRLAAAEQAGERARGLTRRLLTFARGGEPVKRTVEVADLLREAARDGAAGRIRCDLSLPPNLWAIDADAGQIAHAVQSLLRRAGTNAERVELSAENIAAEAPRPVGAPGGAAVRIVVAAAGRAGRDAEEDHDARASAWLDLAAAYSIAQRHGGALLMPDAEGAATLELWLPALATPRPVVPVGDGVPSGRRVRVLAMDDEPLIREVMRLYLERRGFEAVTAAEGREAIDLYRRAFGAGRRFDVVILDMTVPGGMGAAEAIAGLREIDPGVRAIVASGFATDPLMARCREHGFAAALTKPFRASELGEALDDVLRG